MDRHLVCTVVALVGMGLFNGVSVVQAKDVPRVALSDKQAYPESVTASADGTLYVGSPANGGIMRIAPGATKDVSWIQMGCRRAALASF